MTPLCKDDYLLLRQDADLIEADEHGEKVLRLADGNFLKLFRRKRFFSSALFYPYAKRFADNAVTLRELGIHSPHILDVYRIRSLQRDAVRYAPLPGRSLRQVSEEHEKLALRTQLGEFIAHLHNQGIYFRSLHLGNIIISPEGELGLIDIADLYAGRGSLCKLKRLRNFRHILRNPSDQEWLLGTNNSAFFDSYMHHCTLQITPTELAKLLNKTKT